MGNMHNKRLILRLLLAAGALAAVAAMSAAMSALSAAESSLSFATAPQTVAAGQTSGVITVALPSGSTGPATVKLTSSSQTGKFRNQADSAYVTSVSIASGKTQASFRYRDNAAGAPVITGAATSKQWAGTISGRQTETVTPAALRSEERRVGKECRSRWS